MKKIAKLLCTLLSLVLLFSLFSVTAAADTTDEGNAGAGFPSDSAPASSKVTCRAIYYQDSSKSVTVNSVDKTITFEKEITIDGSLFGYFPSYGGRMYEYVGSSHGASVTLDVSEAEYLVILYYVPHYHNYRVGYNRTHHWEACRCGSTLSYDAHVDPAKDEDSICTCGYKFSDNANLGTLWLSNMILKDRFNYEQTEYVADVHTYKPISSSEIKCRAHDAMATVDAPSEVSIQEGMNVVKVTVTAEDKKTTKTYTVYANLGSMVDGILVSNTLTAAGERATAINPQAVDKRGIATYGVSEPLAEKLVFQANSFESKRIIIEPQYNKWGVQTVNVSMSAAVLEKLSETKADLVIKTFSGNIVVPNGELASIAKEGEQSEQVVFTLSKGEDSTVTITLKADDTIIENAKISLEAAEK